MIRPLVFTSFFATASFLAAAPPVPLVNLVDDQTLAVVAVSDAPALVRGWDAGPLAKTWGDPDMVKFLAPLRAQMEIEEWDAQAKEATGLTVRGLLALAKGEVLIALPMFEPAAMEKREAPPFLVALEVGDQAATIEKILADALAKESLQEETEVFAGVKVHSRPLSQKTVSDDVADDAEADAPKRIKSDTLSWAMTDGIWLLSLDKDRVFKAIDAVKQGGVASPLGKSERYLRTRERIGGAQALAYGNVAAFYPLLKEGLERTKARAKGRARPNPLGIDPETVLTAIGLDAFGEFYMALNTGEKETVLDAGVTYTEERGLIKLIAYQPGPVAQPDWVPAKWPSVSTARFSIPKAYASLVETAETISPVLAGMAQGQIRAFNKKAGIDIVRDLIGSLGDDLLSAYAPPASADGGTVPAWTDMDQLIAVSLANEATFTHAIEALKRLAGPAAEQMFTKRDYLGQVIYTLVAPEGANGGKGVSYAIANGTLLVGIGSGGSVAAAIQGMASKEGLFWKRDDVKAVAAEFPPDAVSIQIQDMRFVMESLIEMGVQLQAAATAEDEDADKFIDVKARPDSAVIGRYWGMAGGYSTKTSEGIFTQTRILHPQP